MQQVSSAEPQLMPEGSSVSLNEATETPTTAHEATEFVEFAKTHEDEHGEIIATPAARPSRPVPLGGEVLVASPDMARDVNDTRLGVARQDILRPTTISEEVEIKNKTISAELRKPSEVYSWEQSMAITIVERMRLPQMRGRYTMSHERELIRREARVGAQALGEVPEGHHREFFCLDRHTWVWFEEFQDAATRTTEQLNVHYEFQPRGVLKVVNGDARGYVEGKELTGLLGAIKTYHDRVATEVYGYTLA